MCEALTHTGFLPDDKPEMEAIDQQLCQDLLSLNFIGIRTHDREKEPEHEE